MPLQHDHFKLLIDAGDEFVDVDQAAQIFPDGGVVFDGSLFVQPPERRYGEKFRQFAVGGDARFVRQIPLVRFEFGAVLFAELDLRLERGLLRLVFSAV